MKQDNASGPLDRSGGEIDDLPEPRLFENDALSETAIDGDDTFKLSLPFEKITPVASVGDSSARAAETARLASLLRADSEDSADIAASERIQNPSPAIYLPGNKQRQSRSILTIVLSIMSALVLVGVGIIFAVKSQAATPEQTAFEAYSARHLAVAKADRALTATYDAIVAAKAAAESFNLAAAAGLAAVAGVTDEPARSEVEAQRVAVATAITGIIVTDPAEAPFDSPDVGSESNLAEVATGLDQLMEEATRIEAAQTDLDEAQTAITDARETFLASFTDFADTIPASASAITAANQEADPQWRDAVTMAAAAVVTAVGNDSGAAELQAYAAAALALQGENARVLSEQETEQGEDEVVPRRTPVRPGGESPPDAGPPTEENGNPEQGGPGQGGDSGDDVQSPPEPEPEVPPTQNPEQDPGSSGLQR